MNPTIERIYATGHVEDADGQVVPDATSVNYADGAMLYHLVRREGLRDTLEVGLAHGLSALFICQAHRDNGEGCHLALDPWQDRTYRNTGRLSIERAGLEDTFRFRQAMSFEALPQLHAEGEQFDFAFVDGSHLFDYVMVDFFYIDRMLREGGLIAFDDLWMPGVRKAVNFALRNRGYRLADLPSAGVSPPRWKRAARVGRRFLQAPFERDWAIKMLPGNIGVLRKTGNFNRTWDFHRSF